MSLNTDFNLSPYYDDFYAVGADGLSPSEKYYRVLFKPATAVQARELTQLQTTLQTQIDRFGTNILKEGSIVSGGNFIEMNPLSYVKLLDAGTDENSNVIAIEPSIYVGMKAVGKTTGLEAIIIEAVNGLETKDPDLNTIYVRYINNALNGSNENIGKFSDTEEIEIQYLDTNSVWTAYHTVTAAGSVASNSVGDGYGVRCGDGIIFQKGHFVSFKDAITIVSKYDTAPDGVVVGFQTIETIVNSNQDTSLLDNASGFNNYNAPGADRLMLTPVLAVKTLAAAKADETFFALQEYQSGRVVRRRLTTQFNMIEKFAERRTYDESGNYVVNDFPIRVDQSTSNTSNLAISVGQGLAYIFGKRVELVGDLKIEIPEATSTSSVSGQDIITNTGNYVVANSISGDFRTDIFAKSNVYIGATSRGTAYVRDVETQTDGNHRLYLFNISMNSGYNFADATAIGYDANTAVATLSSSEIIDPSFKSSIIPIGRNFIENIDAANSNYTYRHRLTGTMNSTGSLTITLSGSDTFPYSVGALNSDQLKEIIVIASQTVGPVSLGDYLTITSATVNSSTSMTVQVLEEPGANLTVSAYHNAVKTGASFKNKNIVTAYVKIQANTNVNTTTGDYCLGLPDAFELLGVWKGTTYSESETNVTDSFSLVKNQKDTHYGLSRIMKKKSLTIGANDLLLVKVKVFQNTTGSTYFNFNSYADSIDDVSTTLPANKIRTENVPSYTADDGTVLYMRDVLDFRPYAANTAVYSTTIASATINPSATMTFSNVSFPAPNKTAEVSYSYYQGRNDRLIVDDNGNFVVISGAPSDNPTTPAEPAKGMSLAVFHIPPYPSLPMTLATRAGKPDYGITMTKIKNRRYTMKDIGTIDARVQNLEYYTSLSLLETNTKDLLITDSTGANRFKNGFLVDNFENLSVADLNDLQFAAGVDPAYKELTPKFRSYPIRLKPTSVSDATDFGEAASLTKDDVSVISQPYASDVKSCTTDFYKYEGTMRLNPAYDMGPDTSRAPDINFSIDLATPFAEFADALSEFVPLQSVTSEVVSQSTRRGGGGSRTTTTITLETTRTLTVNDSTTTESLGDFVTNTEFSPYMRGIDVQISANGLRPNTRFYFYFDGQDVNSNVASGRLNGTSVVRSSDFGSQVITSNSDGTLYAVFRIPEGTFFVGDRTLEIFDAAIYSSRDSATSYASRVYSGFNYSVEKTGLAATTRNAEIDIATTTRTLTSTTRRGGSDPIAQTFIIDAENSSDNSIMVTKLDLYFASKSTVGNGVGIQIRETVNGYPGQTIVPFSEVHLSADEVSANSSVAIYPTTVTFQAPVALKTDTEYAIVIAPDANDPDYRVWISRTGGTDVDTALAITQDTNAGVLFTSTNNKAWTPYQNENLKFELYKALFNVSSGSISMTHRDYEFFTVENMSTAFNQGETVFRSASNLSGTISVVSGNTTITGSSTLFDAELNVGEHLIYKPTSTTYQVLKISAINSNTALTVSDVPFSTNAAANFFSSPTGSVVYTNTGTPKTVVLENSSSKTGFYFQASDTIIGADSNATATISSVDDQQVSYLQSNIARSNFTTTRTDLSATKAWNGSSSTVADLEFNDNNYLVDSPVYIRSRSNEYANAQSNTFELKVDLSSTSTSTIDTSPLVDHETSGIMIYQYLVNNDSTDETTNEGDATSRYISKKVVLADGLDADDLRVYLTAYRPAGTTVEVYAKFQNSTDSRDFYDIEWTKLAIKAETDLTSSIADRFDYQEMQFELGTTVLGAGEGGYLVNDVLTYSAADGSKYTSYKNFAIKIVLLASAHNIVPRVKDMRAIAVS